MDAEFSRLSQAYIELLKTIGERAAIPQEALQKPDVNMRNYSRRPIPIFAQVASTWGVEGSAYQSIGRIKDLWLVSHAYLVQT